MSNEHTGFLGLSSKTEKDTFITRSSDNHIFTLILLSFFWIF